MADFVYNIAKKGLLDGTLDLDTGGDDIRVLLLEAATDEDPDDTTITEVLAHAGTTELSSTNYARQALTSEATTQDDTNDLAFFDAGNVTFSNIVLAASETVVAMVVYKFDTDDDNSIPLIFIDSASGLPLTPNGSDIQITWAAGGILSLADA